MMRWRWEMVGLVLWAVATTTAFLLHSQGVRQQPIRLTLADGTLIHGTLYRANTVAPLRKAPAAVVLHGLAMTHRSCEAALSKPLARSGFVVLGIDLRGHGRSGGRLPQSWFHDLDHILELRTEQPEVEAALEYLKALPNVDTKRVDLVGHSLGGLAAVNAACADTDVASVVAISAAPQTCDVQRPRNLLLLVGDFDRLIPPPRLFSALRRATGGVLSEVGVPFGKLKQGTGRLLWVAHWVSHLSPLFDPAASRRAVHWAAFSVGYNPGPVCVGRLLGIGCAVLAAVLAGGVACTGMLRRLLERILPVPIVSTGSWGRVAVAFVLCVAAAPAAAFLGNRLPSGGMLYAAATVALFALLALVWMAAASVKWRVACGAWRVKTNLLSRHAPHATRHAMTGAAVGMLGALLGLVWLGLPFGAAWMDLMPGGRRAGVALLLLPLLLPWNLLLAWGMQRAVPAQGRWSGAVRGLAWMAVPIAVWMGNELFNDCSPFFGISVTMLAAVFLPVLPLWLVPDRKGMTMARAVCLAVSAAWLYACHLPFVCGG